MNGSFKEEAYDTHKNLYNITKIADYIYNNR